MENNYEVLSLVPQCVCKTERDASEPTTVGAIATLAARSSGPCGELVYETSQLRLRFLRSRCMYSRLYEKAYIVAGATVL